MYFVKVMNVHVRKGIHKEILFSEGLNPKLTMFLGEGEDHSVKTPLCEVGFFQKNEFFLYIASPLLTTKEN